MTRSQLTTEETSNYFATYINKVAEGHELVEALIGSFQQAKETVSTLTEDQLTYRYEEGKWTIKEILVHLMDTEKIFNYRALRYARKDYTPLVGFEQDDYVPHSGANDRSIQSIMNEYELLRACTISQFKNFTDEMLLRKGSVGGNKLSVRAIGFMQSGHIVHHIRIIKERYLNNPT